MCNETDNPTSRLSAIIHKANPFALRFAFALALSITFISVTNAGGSHHDGDNKDIEKYEIGYTKVWFKDDSRVFDPRLDWSCNSVANNLILDARGIRTCDFNGDLISDVPSGQRGKRTLPLRIYYPVDKEDTRHASQPTFADVSYGGSISDCKIRTAGTQTGSIFRQVSFGGLGANYSFITPSTVGGGLTDLFLPSNYINDSLVTEYCTTPQGVWTNAKPAKDKFPVITYSHGNGGTDYIVPELFNLVKSGYIVLVVEHVGDGPIYFPQSIVQSNRVPDNIKPRISSTGIYQTQEIFLGNPAFDSEQDIKARAEDILAVVDFAKKLNASGDPQTLLLASDKNILKKLKGNLALDKLGYFGTSNGGSAGLAAMVKMKFRNIYKAAIINIGSTIYTPLQNKVSGAHLQSVFLRNDILQPDGYVYNQDAVDDVITQSVPMLTYVGVQDDFTILEVCAARASCSASAPGNVRLANLSTRSNLHALHVNGVVMGATGPQYLLNIDNMDHGSVYYFGVFDNTPSIDAVLPNTVYKESIWDGAGNLLYVPGPNPLHGLITRYQLLDSNLLDGISNLYTRTWMDVYLKSKLCSNDRDVKIRDDDGNVVVVIPKTWNNIQILKSYAHYAPAGVESAVFNNLLMGLHVKGNPENVVCRNH